MSSPTVIVVPAVPPARVTPVAGAAVPTPTTPAVQPVQPRPVPAAAILSVQTARADAETVRRLQAELAALRARFPLAG